MPSDTPDFTAMTTEEKLNWLCKTVAELQAEFQPLLRRYQQSSQANGFLRNRRPKEPANHG